VRLEKEPLFMPMEEIMWQHQRNLIYLAHLLTYILILAILLGPKAHPHMTIAEKLAEHQASIAIYFSPGLFFHVFWSECD